MRQSTETAPKLTIHDFTLEVVSQFTYLGSTTSANGSLDAELRKRIGKAATTMTKLSSRVWENKKLTTQTKTAVYRACVLSTLLSLWKRIMDHLRGSGKALTHVPHALSSPHPFHTLDG